MPRTSPDFVQSCRKHKASGQAMVTLNSKDHYLGQYGAAASRAEYNRLIAEWVARGRQLPNATGGMTVVELCWAYWNAVGNRPDSGKADLKGVLGIVRRAYSMALVPEFGPKAHRIVREKMRELGCSRTYFNREVA